MLYVCSLGSRGGPRGQHERGEAVAAAGQVDGGAAAKQHLRGGVVAQSDALVQRALLRLKCLSLLPSFYSQNPIGISMSD